MQSINHMSKKQLQIRNSTAEFLIFQAEDKATGVQVFYENETIWATQEAIATLFDKGRTTITEHLKHIFESGELEQQSVCRKFRHTAADGKKEHAETEFDKYRIVQDRLFESDFDRFALPTLPFEDKEA